MLDFDRETNLKNIRRMRAEVPNGILISGKNCTYTNHATSHIIQTNHSSKKQFKKVEY